MHRPDNQLPTDARIEDIAVTVALGLLERGGFPGRWADHHPAGTRIGSGYDKNNAERVSRH